MSNTNQTPFAGLDSTGAVLLVKVTTVKSLFPGNPNGLVAGQSGGAVTPPDEIWDYNNKVTYYCTTTGDQKTTVWTPVIYATQQQPGTPPSQQIDLSSPPPIGNVAPNVGNFSAVNAPAGSLQGVHIGDSVPAAAVCAVTLRATTSFVLGSGPAPAVQQITGTVSDPVIAQLLSAMAGFGLVINNTTAQSISISGGAGALSLAGGQGAFSLTAVTNITVNGGQGLLSLVGSAGNFTLTTTTQGQTPLRAALATSMFGVQVAFQYNSSWSAAAGNTCYNNPAQIQQALDGLNPAGRGTGVSVMRVDAHYMMGGTTAGTNLQTTLNLSGYKALLYGGYPIAGNNYDAEVTYMTGLSASQVYGFEGFLEVDTNSWSFVANNYGCILDYNGTTYTGWQGVAAFQINLATNTIWLDATKTLMRWSIATPSNGAVGNAGMVALNALGQPGASTMNTGNCHTYQKQGANPFEAVYGQMLSNLSTECADTIALNLPSAITETGFLDLGTADSYNMHGTEASVAFNYVMLVFNAIYNNLAISATKLKYVNFYELFNTGTFGNTGGVNGGTEEDCFGIYRYDGTPKQAAIALHDIFAIIGDSASNAKTFTTSNLSITVGTGFPTGTYPNGTPYVLLQKADGTSYVLIWQNYNVYLNSAAVSPPAAVTATLSFGSTYTKIERFDPLGRAATLAGTPAAPGTTLAQMTGSITPFLDITASPYNASGTGGSGAASANTTAINNALAAAHTAGKAVYIPPGTFYYNGNLTCNGVTLYGAGTSSVLQAYNSGTIQECIHIQGTGAHLSNFAMNGITASGRTGSDSNSSMIQVDSGATNWEIDNLSINGSATTGMKVYGASAGKIHSNTVANTWADAIHMTGVAHDVEIWDNFVDHSGDDGISIIGYSSDAGPCYNINVHNNYVYAYGGTGSSHLGRGMSACGAHDCSFTNNYVDGLGSPNAGQYAGIYLACEGGSFPEWNTQNITASGNTLRRCGWSGVHGAILCYQNQSNRTMSGNTFSSNLIITPGYMPVQCTGAYSDTLTVTGNTAYWTGGTFISVGSATVTQSNNVINSPTGYNPPAPPTAGFGTDPAFTNSGGGIGTPAAAQTVNSANSITWSFQGPMIIKLTP